MKDLKLHEAAVFGHNQSGMATSTAIACLEITALGL